MSLLEDKKRVEKKYLMLKMVSLSRLFIEKMKKIVY
jgi:hypothetical protein